MPECDRAASSHGRSESTTATATPRTHSRNNATAFPQHKKCKPQSQRTQSLSRDQAEERSIPAASIRALWLAPACCASHPWTSRDLPENMRETKSAEALPVLRAEMKTRPRGSSDACCGYDPRRKPK